MLKDSDSSKYLRIGMNPTNEVWGVTYKCGSTSLFSWQARERTFTELRKGDHVKIFVRHPADRLVSAWNWFTNHHNSVLRRVEEQSPKDSVLILQPGLGLEEWFEVAQRHWNAHWVPQAEIHRRWREFELVDLADCAFGHGKKTREDSSWEQYMPNEDFKSKVLSFYRDDLEMWETVLSGADTTTHRVS